MSKSGYFNLSIRAPHRLEMMREDFAKHATKYPYCPEHAKPASWRDMRGTTYKSFNAYCGVLDQGGKDQWYTHCGQYFAREIYVDEIENSPIDHTGWYSDIHCEEKIRGIVVRLSHGRFIPGCVQTMNDERVYRNEIFDNIRDAARFADSCAQNLAESEQEYSQRWSEAREIEDEIETALRRVKELIVLRHAQCMEYVRQELRDTIESIRENREKLATEYKGVL